MHIRQLPSGSWRWMVSVNGQRFTGTQPTKWQAQQSGLEAQIAAGKAFSAVKAGDHERPTVDMLLRLHIDQQGYAATTANDLRAIVDRLPASISDAKVRDVDSMTAELWYRQLNREGWSVHRIRRLHMVLSSAWKRAYRYGWTTTTVFANVDKPEAPVADVRPPTTDEVQKVMGVVSGQLWLFLRLASVTGARRGELIGLQWADVAQVRDEIAIRRSVAHINKTAVVSQGKTGKRGHRIVAIDGDTMAALRHHHQTQQDQAARADIPEPVWVFSHDAGYSPWRGDYISREFRRACAKAGVSGVRLHDLRHYMATMMLTDGEAVTVVAHRLGHSSPAVTFGVYSHYVAAADQEAAARMAARLAPPVDLELDRQAAARMESNLA